MDGSVACASAIAIGVVAPCTTGVGDIVACATMAAAGVAPCCTTAADAGALPVASAPDIGVATLSDVVSTWRSTISAALRSGVEDEDGESDPDANEASRNRPEFWNACLMSLPVRP